MRFKKKYLHKEIRFGMLPRILSDIQKSIPGRLLVSRNGIKYRTQATYSIFLMSGSIGTTDDAELQEILKEYRSEIVGLNARLNCYLSGSDVSHILVKPPAFSFEFRQSDISIQFAYNTLTNIKLFVEEIERDLDLESSNIQDEVSLNSLSKTIFLSHSFDEFGKGYAYELIRFLSLLGFSVITGKEYSSKSISKKVKDRLDAQEIVIAVLSGSRAGSWLIQEASAAEFLKKPLILLIEDGLEIELGILENKEYIRFAPQRIETAFLSILEGLKELGYNLG